MNKQKITALFLDIGGVLLTNGWNRVARKKAAEYFKLDDGVMEDRHHIPVETFELGKITVEAYLRRVVFADHQGFEIQDFKECMFAHPTGHFEMLSLIAAPISSCLSGSRKILA